MNNFNYKEYIDIGEQITSTSTCRKLYFNYLPICLFHYPKPLE